MREVHKAVSEEPRARVRRRLAAILIAGYAQLWPGDEAEGFTGLKEVLNDVIEPQVAAFEGRVVNSTGERALTEFESAVEAARCALA